MGHNNTVSSQCMNTFFRRLSPRSHTCINVHTAIQRLQLEKEVRGELYDKLSLQS